jgi:hypothetical protein
MSVHTVLEARYQDLEDYLCHTFKLQRQEVLDDVFVKAVGKIIRLAHTHDPLKSSEWTWMVMVARGVAFQVLERLDKRTGTNPRAPVDVYLRHDRQELQDYHFDSRTPEQELSDKQIEEE